MPYTPPYDTNSDAGYGRISNRFHSSRQAGKAYPYVEVEEIEEYKDEETEDAVRSKIDYPIRSDTYSAAGTDPFYFAAGNIKLSDCFERPDYVLCEIHALGDSMSPIKINNKKVGLGRTSGASFPGGVGNYRRTGTKKGYFSTPPKVNFNKSEDYEVIDEDEPIFNLKDLVVKQDKRKGTFSLGTGIFNR